LFGENMTERKFYKTTIVFEVLSEEPLSGDESLELLHYKITEGDCSGRRISSNQEEINGKQAADALYAHGSEPSFFMLDDEGKSAN
jgi:predicted metal-binding protein